MAREDVDIRIENVLLRLGATVAHCTPCYEKVKLMIVFASSHGGWKFWLGKLGVIAEASPKI